MTKAEKQAKKAHSNYLETLNDHDFMAFVRMVGRADKADFRIAHVHNGGVPLGTASTMDKALAMTAAISVARHIPVRELGVYPRGRN